MFKRMAMIALLCVTLASAKTYSFTIGNPTQAGKTQLKPGDYSIKLEGSQVVLMDHAGHRIDATAKLETANSKFNETSVATSMADGANRIDWIGLQGSKNKVVFQ